MRHHLHLAAALLLTTAPPIHAQIHSPQVNLHRHHAEDDISWILQYAIPAPDGRENDLAHDPRFKTLLAQNLTAPQTFWGQNTSLANTAFDFLGGPPGRVFLDGNRYLNADACVQHFCPSRGLLWIDTALPKPLVVFAAVDWISENRATDDSDAAYTLWVFPNRALDSTEIPAALKHSVARWTEHPSSGSTGLQNITRVFLVDPDGTPHTLSPSSIGAHNGLPAETSTEAAPSAPDPDLTPAPEPKAKP